MTNNDLTLLGVLVDHSLSMTVSQAAMQRGLNSFITEQAGVPGQCEITLAEFDHEYRLVWPVQDIKKAGRYELVPRGNTALLDAMGRFITDIGTDLRNRHESLRPDKVIILVVTDGEENASRTWTRTAVKQLVENQQGQWKWEFIFLGANMDAIAEGGSVGFLAANSMTFNQTSSAAIGNTYDSITRNVADYRRGVVASASFSAQNRMDAMVDDEGKTE